MSEDGTPDEAKEWEDLEHSNLDAMYAHAKVNLPDLPYYKIFTKEERIVAKCSAKFRCDVCGKILFYTDILNLSDFYPIMSIVCADCKDKHQKTFDEKREKIASENK